MNIKPYILLFSFLQLVILLGCQNNRFQTESGKELLEIKRITDCDSLLNNEIFQKNTTMTWPDTKPKSIVEAVKLFDSMTNEYHEHCLTICPADKFYFGFGMAMRNEWFHQGTVQFRNQIEHKLDLHPDISSGIVLNLYLKMKKKEKVNFAEEFDNEYFNELKEKTKKEYETIQGQINKLMLR